MATTPHIDVRCSFCNRTRRQAGRLIVGPEARICRACVAECTAIVEERRTMHVPQSLRRHALIRHTRGWRERRR
jgi:ATP-dependent protease Clp ATPase subunit